MNKNSMLSIFLLVGVIFDLHAGNKSHQLTLLRKEQRCQKFNSQKNPESPFGKAIPATVLQAREFKAQQAANMVFVEFVRQTKQK